MRNRQGLIVMLFLIFLMAVGAYQSPPTLEEVKVKKTPVPTKQDTTAVCGGLVF